MEGVESTVYSVSGLTIRKGSDVAQNVFASHTKNDIAVLQVGTSDVENSSIVQLCENYDKLIDSAAETAPESKIIEKCSLTNQAIFIDASPPLQQLNYRADGYHFSYKGLSLLARYVSNYLCHNLNFPLSRQHLQA